MRRLGLVAVATCGCVSFSTLQTASTVPNGELRASVQPEFFVFKPPSGDTEYAFPPVEASVRYGIADDTDVGVRAGNTGATFSVKRQAGSGSLILGWEPSVGILIYKGARTNRNDTLVNLSAGMAFLIGSRSDRGELVVGPKLAFLYQNSGGWTDSSCSAAA